MRRAPASCRRGRGEKKVGCPGVWILVPQWNSPPAMASSVIITDRSHHHISHRYLTLPFTRPLPAIAHLLPCTCNNKTVDSPGPTVAPVSSKHNGSPTIPTRQALLNNTAHLVLTYSLATLDLSHSFRYAYTPNTLSSLSPPPHTLPPPPR